MAAATAICTTVAPSTSRAERRSRAALSAGGVRTRIATTNDQARNAKASTRWVQWSAASGAAGGSTLPLQSGRPRQRRPAWKLATWAPKRITTKPSAAVARPRGHERRAGRLESRRLGCPRDGGPERHDQQGGQQQHGVGQMGDDRPRAARPA